MWEGSAGGYEYRGCGIFLEGVARAEDTHMGVLRCVCFLDRQHPEDTHSEVLRSVLLRAWAEDTHQVRRLGGWGYGGSGMGFWHHCGRHSQDWEVVVVVWWWWWWREGAVVVPARPLRVGAPCIPFRFLFLPAFDWAPSAPHARSYSQSAMNVSLMQGSEHSWGC